MMISLFNNDVHLLQEAKRDLVFNTGASSSMSPSREDFIGDLETPKYSMVRGLKGDIEIAGQLNCYVDNLQ
jgi:hypothetical protein